MRDLQRARALTQVSQKLRTECLPIFYSSNVFNIVCAVDLLRWLRIVGINCQHLRTLKLEDGVVESEALNTQLVSPVEFSMQLIQESHNSTKPAYHFVRLYMEK